MQFQGILLASFWSLIILYGFIKWNPLGSKPLIVSLFSTKIVCTFLVQAVYTYYYTDRETADIYRFFDDGVILYKALFTDVGAFAQMMLGIEFHPDYLKTNYYEVMNTWIKPYDTGVYNDNHFMVRVNALFMLLSGGYYEVHGVLFSSLALLSLIWLGRSLVAPPYQSFAIIAAVLFPSSLIWLSGGLKETALVIGLAGFFAGLNLFGENMLPKGRRVLFMLSILVLAQVKPYFIAALVPSTLAVLMGMRFTRSTFAALSTWLAIILCTGLLIHFWWFDLLGMIIQKQHDFIRHAEHVGSGSYYFIPLLQPDLLNILSYLPTACMNALAKPWVWQARSTPEMLVVAENFLILAGTLLSIIGYKKDRRAGSTLLWILLTCLPIIFLIGTVTPVYGAVMRYRSPVLVLLIIAFTPFIVNGYHRIASKMYQ